MSIKDEIQSTVSNNDVVLFMKGTPDFPQCGFSGQVVQILNYLDVSYKPVNCLANDEICQGSRISPIGRPSLSFTSRANSSAAATLSGKCSNRANSWRIWRTRGSPATSQPRPNHCRRLIRSKLTYGLSFWRFRLETRILNQMPMLARRAAGIWVFASKIRCSRNGSAKSVLRRSQASPVRLFSCREGEDR